MLTKRELARRLAPIVGNQVVGREVVDLFFDLIMDSVARGEKVMITGIGKWQRDLHPARAFTHPATGEEGWREAKPYPRFTASPLLVERVRTGSVESAKPKNRGRSANLLRAREEAERAAERRRAERAAQG